MNTTLAVVVSAIVILITALVVITIFSGGVNQVGSLTNARSVCATQASSSCRATNSLPLLWNTPTVSITNPSGQGGNILVACGGTGANDLKLGSDCSGYGGTATTGGTTTTGCCLSPDKRTCNNNVVSSSCTGGWTFGSGRSCTVVAGGGGTSNC